MMKINIFFLFSIMLTHIAAAAQFGDYTYQVINDSVEITHFSDRAFTGHLDIPSEIDGKPVTSISSNPNDSSQQAFSFCDFSSVTIPNTVTNIGSIAFAACFNLQSVTIPDSVTHIGDSAFYQCHGLTSVHLGSSVESLGSLSFFINSNLHTISFPESLRIIGERAFEGCHLRSLTLPAGLTQVGRRAFFQSKELASVTIQGGETLFDFGVFQDCDNLQLVTLESGLNSESDQPFYNCFALRSLIFKSDAPSSLAPLKNEDTNFATNFSIYFLDGLTGFTSPIWQNYPCKMLSSPNGFAAEWLTNHQLDTQTDLAIDYNQDGYPLLMAYALNLPPSVNINKMMPKLQPQQDDFKMHLSFYGSAPGVTYIVEHSSNLITWTQSNIEISIPDAQGMRTAYVSAFLDNSSRYMRLNVTLN